MSRNEFLSSILRAFYRHARERVGDNYDAYRFSSDGIDRSAFDLDWHVGNLALFMEHVDGFYEAYRLLADRASQDLFVSLILYRLLGHSHVRIREEATASAESAGIREVERLAAGKSQLEVGEMFGGLKHFSGVEFLGRTFEIECWAGSVFYAFVRKQYFLERPNAVVRPEPGDIVIDGGACFGDNALAFAAAVKNGHVHSFEPLPSYLTVCRQNVRQNGLEDVVSLWPYALSDRTGNLETPMRSDNGGSPAFSIVGREDELPTIAIDDFVERERLDRVDFIKMDVEGAELAALKGAAGAITAFRPKLAISLYHDFRDFFLIPAYLAKTHPFYEFHLDHYTIHAGETVFYARPAK